MKTKMFQVPAGEYDCEIVEITSDRDGKARRVITWMSFPPSFDRYRGNLRWC